MVERLQPGEFRPRMPFHMVWLATNACTARCLHCSSNSAVRMPDELKIDEVRDLIDQLADVGVVDLGISGGEPLIRKDLLQVIVHAKRRGMSVGVGSNGAKLGPERAAGLVSAGLNRLQISLDGLGAAHDELRRWPGLFSRALQTIRIAQSAGLRVHVCCTINRLNFRDLDAFASVVAGLGVRRLNFSRFVPTGRGADSLDLDNQSWRFAIEQCARIRARYEPEIEIVSHLAQQILVDKDVADMPGFIGCQAGQAQGCVTANGTVLPCVLLPIPLGNIRDRPFRDIWQTSSIVRAFQERTELGGNCGICALKDRCGGCRAVAFSKTGDPLAADPRCWLTGPASCGILQ
jgi:AdoMet-dependent heme synthase